MPQMITILPSGLVTTLELDKEPTLKQLQHGVGGYIEHINLNWLGETVHGYVNEDGRRLCLPWNPKATAIYHNTAGDVFPYTRLNEDPHEYIHPHKAIIVGPMVIWTGEIS